MPTGTGKSQLSALTPALKAGHAGRVGSSPKQDLGGRLPPGINGGIAQLDSATIAPVKEGPNAGKLQFVAVGIVKSPVEHDGQKIAGAQFRKFIPLHDQKRGDQMLTASDFFNGYDLPGGARVDGVVDVVARLMGKEVIGEETDPDNMEQTLAALTAAKPHFRFRTWAGDKTEIIQRKDGKFILQTVKGRFVKGPWPTKEAAEKANPYAGQDPLVNEVWGAYTPFSDNGSPSDGVDDHTEESLEPNGSAAGEAGAIDFDALTKEAESSNKAARAAAEKKFIELAAKVGIEKQRVVDAKNWAEVVAMIQEADAGSLGGSSDDEEIEEDGDSEDEEVGEEEEAAWEPKKDVACIYQRSVTVKNKRTGKTTKQRKPIEVNPSSVNVKNGTATVKSLDDGKVYKDVSFTDLEPAS